MTLWFQNKRETSREQHNSAPRAEHKILTLIRDVVLVSHVENLNKTLNETNFEKSLLTKKSFEKKSHCAGKKSEKGIL